MYKQLMRWPLLAVFVLSPWIASCVTNPVTGDTELGLVSEAQEKELGRTNYGPYRQAQGGDYVADPELVKYVRRVGQKVARQSDRKLPYEFNVVNDSTPNAWALPGGKIAINRGLLVELQSEAELAAVLGHEIVHAAARHSAQSMERGLLMQGAILAVGVALADTDYAQAGMLGAQVGAAAGQQHYSREAEREADHYGIHYMTRAGYDPSAAVGLQKTFVRLSDGHEPGWVEGLFASHPPSPERVENNSRLVARLGNPGGEIGRERYRKAMARLIRTKPAYEAYDDAKVAFEKKQHDKAMSLVDKAIRIEPKEALFHTLRGEIQEAKGNNQQALDSYNRAMKLNPGYYRVPLARGLLRQKMGKPKAARKDLKLSRKLLPTAEGEYGLGMVERSAGNRQAAAVHFRNAAQSNSAVGRAAARQLNKLNKMPKDRTSQRKALPADPKKVLKTKLLLNKKGELAVRVKNNGPRPVNQVRLLVLERKRKRVNELVRVDSRRQIAAGKAIRVPTGEGPMSPARLKSLAVVVEQAGYAN